MMPIVKGNKSTLFQIMVYTVVLFIFSMSLLAFGAGWFYFIAAVVLGGFFIKKAYQAMRTESEKIIKGLFGYSIIYLFALFVAVIVDSYLV